jgi:hypothetical protein
MKVVEYYAANNTTKSLENKLRVARLWLLFNSKSRRLRFRVRTLEGAIKIRTGRGWK